MKKIVAGGFILISAVFLYIGVHVPAALHLRYVGSWRTPPGRYGTALEETGGNIAAIISIVLCIIGISLLFWGVISKQLTRQSDVNDRGD